MTDQTPQPPAAGMVEPFKGPFRVILEQGDENLGFVVDAEDYGVTDLMAAMQAQWLCDRLNATTPAEGERESWTRGPFVDEIEAAEVADRFFDAHTANGEGPMSIERQGCPVATLWRGTKLVAATTIVRDAINNSHVLALQARATPSAAEGWVVAQGHCDVTLTERFTNPRCACQTYDGNKGPCLSFEKGMSEACVYCDHSKECHRQLVREAINTIETNARRATTEASQAHMLLRHGAFKEAGAIIQRALAAAPASPSPGVLTEEECAAVQWLRELAGDSAGMSAKVLAIIDKHIHKPKEGGE